MMSLENNVAETILLNICKDSRAAMYANLLCCLYCSDSSALEEGVSRVTVLVFLFLIIRPINNLLVIQSVV
jgi:hypothetical protein